MDAEADNVPWKSHEEEGQDVHIIIECRKSGNVAGRGARAWEGRADPWKQVNLK